MPVRTYLVLALWMSATQLAVAAERKASVSPSSIGASVAAPIVGYFVTPDGLVAIQGISNAAHARLAASMHADRTILPPGEAYAWMEKAGNVYVSALPGSGPAGVPDAWAGADLIAFSSTGGAAVLYRAGGGFQVIGGLPGAPQVVRVVAAPTGDGNISAIAISDDSKTLLAASASGVYLSTGDKDWSFVMPGQASAIAFLPGRADAIVAVNDFVYRLHGSTPIPLLSRAGSPAAMLGSDDGRRAVILNADGHEALVLDVENGATTRIAIGTAARGLQRGRDGTIIFVPQQGKSPWLLDMRSQTVSFAPELPDGVAQ